jgi:hypothetical protein
MSKPVTIESLWEDHLWLYVLGVVMIATVVLCFLVIREQIQGLPQVRTAVVEELRCSYGRIVLTTHADDGTSAAKCAEAK